MRLSILIIGAGLIAGTAEGPAQVTRGKTMYSLKEAQDYALENNLNIVNARLDVDAARKRIWENTAAGLPQVSASAGYTNNLQLMTTLIPAEFFQGEPGTFIPVQFGTQHNASANVIATQLLFSGPYIVGLEAASKYKELTERNLVRSESDIREAVAQSYYSILLAEAGRDAYSKNLESMNQRLGETKAMLETGFIEETDVDQLSITVANLENEYRAAEQLANLSYRMLLYQMGRELDAQIGISESLDDIIADLTNDLMQQEFQVEDHIDYKIMNSQEQLAYLQVKMYKFEYLPTLSANLSHTQMAMRRDFNFFDFDQEWYPSTTLGFNLSIPVFSSGQRRARISQSLVELEKTKNLKSTLADGLELAVRQARIDFRTACGQYLNEKRNVDLAQKVFDHTAVKYRNGLASSLELTMASDQLTGAQTGYISSTVELLTARMRLEKALGEL